MPIFVIHCSFTLWSYRIRLLYLSSGFSRKMLE